MIDLSKEHIVTFKEGAKHLPRRRAGKPTHASTLHRWATIGVLADDGARVFMEKINVGGTVCTSIEAIQRFCNRLTGTPAEAGAEMPKAAQRPVNDLVDLELRRRGL